MLPEACMWSNGFIETQLARFLCCERMMEIRSEAEHDTGTSSPPGRRYFAKLGERATWILLKRSRARSTSSPVSVQSNRVSKRGLEMRASALGPALQIVCLGA